MIKTVLAGALALAMMGPLSVSQHGFGPAPASAQEAAAVVVTVLIGLRMRVVRHNDVASPAR